MSECEHFGKLSEKLHAELGTSWILVHCYNCLDQQACNLETTEKEHERQISDKSGDKDE